MLKIVHSGDKEGLWKWFVFPGSDAEFELYCPPVHEMTAAASAQRFGSPGVNMEGWLALIATKWFRGFRNVCGFDGTALDNTFEQRLKILYDQDVYSFVLQKLNDTAAWREEGNAGSGSAS